MAEVSQPVTRDRHEIDDIKITAVVKATASVNHRGGEDRTFKPRHGKRNNDRVGLPDMRGSLPRVGGRRSAPTRKAVEHTNKPRLVGAFTR